MREFGFYSDDIGDAADWILRNYLSDASDRPDYEGGQNIYFDGWGGLGASAVLAAIANSARSPRYKFDIAIHVDCSVWESRRAMQRRIAEELKLDRSAMDLFDKQDEEDDFSGIDKSSRAEIVDIGKLVFQIVKDQRCLVVFINGSEDEIDFGNFGIPIFDWSGNKVVWTFRGRFRLDPTIKDKVKSAHIYLFVPYLAGYLSNSQILKLVHEEASQVGNDINPTLIRECWFYLCLLYFDHDSLIEYDEDAHASNYWVCDGIIQGDSAWEIGQRLHEAMRLEYLPTKQNNGIWFDWFCSNPIEEKNNVWVSVTSKNIKNQNIQTVPKEATSYFLTLKKSDHLTALPKHWFHQSSKLRVLRLSWCTFSFASPPFIYCSNLRFILIESCRDEDVELIQQTSCLELIGHAKSISSQVIQRMQGYYMDQYAATKYIHWFVIISVG